MKLVQIAEQNKKYYTKEFIYIFNIGAKTQYEEDKKEAERTGRWEDVEHAPNGLLYATCSVCGKRQTVEFTSYCGNCGTKMDLENDEDE